MGIRHWWQAPKGEAGKAAEAFWASCNSAPDRREQLTRWSAFSRSISNQDLSFEELSQLPPTTTLDGQTCSWNLLGSATGALRNKLQRNKPRIQILTADGSRKLRKQAKKLNAFLDGFFASKKVAPEMGRAHMDALYFDNGFVRVGPDGDEVCVKRVRPWDVGVDPVEARSGKVRNLAQRTQLSGADVCDLFKLGKKHALYDKVRVELVEAWHLDEDGRYVASCCGEALADDKYAEDVFPLVALRYLERPQGSPAYAGAS